MADETDATTIAEGTQEGVSAPIRVGTLRRAVLSFLGRFAVMRGAVRELWVVFAFQLLAILAYSLMNSTFVLWLSSDLGYDDRGAGYVVTMWSALMTLFTVLVGSLTDAIGLRKAFFLGVWVCILARAVITFTTFKWLALAGGMLPLALGEALGTPVLIAALRRYSTTMQRAMSFSLFYAVMNAGFYIAGLLFDKLRASLGEYGHWTLPVVGLQLTTYRTLFLISLLVELALVPILYFGLRAGVEATDEGVKITPEQPKYPHESVLNAPRLAARDALRETVRIFAGLWRQPGFYKFLAFLGLAAFVRLVFIHLSYTYPKFGIRELGEGAPIGSMSNINNLLIIFLVPIVGALSQKISAYRMVTVGTIIAAASVYIMALPPEWFQSFADGRLGHVVGHWHLGLTGAVNPYYVMIFLFVVCLSLGESIYSPRTYEYAAAIAPKGQEASYMSISYLPYFLAKLCAATSSGVLLARYCPQTGPRHSNILWLIIALTATIAPVGLILLRRWIRVAEAGRES